MLNTTVDLDKLVREFNTPVPRYTSYPTALDWTSKFDESLFFNALGKVDTDRKLSLYLHIPFCQERCLYCGCNVVVSKKKELAQEYVFHLIREILYKSSFLDGIPEVVQLHAGGGTPNYLGFRIWDEILKILMDTFKLNSATEISIELDPMALSKDYLTKLKELGFNRISFGIQDTNSQVLEAVNRPQSPVHMDKILTHARTLGFHSVNYDFIYGLPYQTPETMKNNIKFIRIYRPDRIAMYSYAHVPWIKHHQKRMPEEAIPDADNKIKIYSEARNALLNIGYEQIGMDHFALPEDDLVKAQKNRALYRNFMGYTTFPDTDLLAFGASAISNVQGVFAQNHSKLKAYTESVKNKKGWFEKGAGLSDDDILRAAVIQDLMNNFFLDFAEFEKRQKGFLINKQTIKFRDYFSSELTQLQRFVTDGYLSVDEKSINVSDSGKFIVRHIACTFDAYRKNSEMTGFSKGV